MDTRFVDKILAGESKVLEFKETLPTSEKIAKTVVVFKRIFAWRKEVGIAKPSITEKGDFVEVELYRENESVQVDVRDGVRDSVDVQKSVREEKRRQRRLIILKYCLEARTSKEILDRLNMMNHSKNRELYITELMKTGLLARTNPDNPKASNQKYITTEAGKLYIEREDDNGRKAR